MRLFLITFFISSILTGQAQKQACWECLIAARNLDANISLARCNEVYKSQKLTTNEKEIVSFVIGRLSLGAGESEIASRYLALSAKSSDSLLSALSNGLLGDCYLEQNKPDLAAMHYAKAADLADNTLFTPYFLHKQGIVFKIQDQKADIERIGSRLRVNHMPFFNLMNLEMFYGKEPSVYDSINRTLLSDQLPPGSYGIGLVNGKQVETGVFSAQIDKAVNELTSYPKPPPSDALIFKKAWDKTVSTMLLQSKELTFALGVGENEFHAYLFGENGYALLPEIESGFANENGVFVPAKLEETMLYRASDKDPGSKAQWDVAMEAIRQEIASEKYQHLLGSALYVTTPETVLMHQLTQKVLEVKTVHFPSDYLSGESFSISQDELKRYFQSHKAEGHLAYPAVRKMKYFAFPVVADKKDTLELMDEMNQLKTAFEQTKNDSLFVIKNSDLKFFNPNFSTAFPASYSHLGKPFTYPDDLNSTMVAAQIGDVIGPYEDGGKLKLIKVIGFNEKLITARHILINKGNDERSHEESRKLANDIASKVTHKNFEEYVRRYSGDQGSVEKGGVYTDFLDYEMVKPFADYGVTAPIGKIGVVETDFGFHIMEVLERKSVRFPKLAIVEKRLLPSGKTVQSTNSTVTRLHTSMTNHLETLTLDQKEHYFDSLANLHGGSKTIVIDEYYPSITGFSLEETNEKMLQIAYGKKVQPYKLFSPVDDSSAWIFPFFLDAFSGQDYNYKQVESIIESDCLSARKSDSIQSFCRRFASLDDLAKGTGLPLLKEDIAWNNLSKNNGLAQFLLSGSKPKAGIQWYDANGAVAYEFVLQRDPKPLVDYSVLKRDFQSALVDKLGNMIRLNTSLSAKTIYNYSLFRLMVR